MKVQIYTAQTPEEARVLVALGVDHVGITPANLGLPGEVDVETARAIVEAISGATSVALSVSAYHLPGGGFHKDLRRVTEFVEAARRI